MGGQMYTMLIIFIETEHKKEAWNLSGSYKKIPNINAKQLQVNGKAFRKGYWQNGS